MAMTLMPAWPTSGAMLNESGDQIQSGGFLPQTVRIAQSNTSIQKNHLKAGR